jgi:hypothetical protein
MSKVIETLERIFPTKKSSGLLNFTTPLKKNKQQYSTNFSTERKGK